MASFSSELQAMAHNVEEMKKQNSSLIQKLSAMEITVQDVKKENGSLRDKQANTEKKVSAMEITMEEHVKRIQKLESDYLMLGQIKSAQSEAEMKNKSDRESATAPTGAPTVRTEEEIQNIIDQSIFHVYKSWSSPVFHLPRGPTPTQIEGYDDIEKHSPYFDMSTGIYTVPLKGKCKFSVRDYVVEGTGSVDWFMCRGDGRRERMEGSGEVYLFDDAVLECEEGDKVWLEGVGVEGDVMVKGVVFGGKMLK